MALTSDAFPGTHGSIDLVGLPQDLSSDERGIAGDGCHED